MPKMNDTPDTCEDKTMTMLEAVLIAVMTGVVNGTVAFRRAHYHSTESSQTS